MDVFGIVLPIVYILAGCALIWFIVELALAVRRMRATVTDLKRQVDPALDNVNRIAKQLPPIIDKVDPLMDRVTLTVDSVNLELMRVDEMLEDITQITGTVSKATTAVDSVTSAPLDIVTNMTNKVRGLFKPKYASSETADMHADEEKTNPIVDFANAAATAAGEAVREQREVQADKRQAAEKRAQENSLKDDTLRSAASVITDEVLANADTDAPSATQASSIPHSEPIDPSLYMVQEVEETGSEDDHIEAVGEVVPSADGGVVISSEILLDVDAGESGSDGEGSVER